MPLLRSCRRASWWGEDRSYEAPPKDTGEATDLSAANLTLTFGLDRSFFVDDEGKDRFGFASKLPEALVRIPHMTGDALEAKPHTGSALFAVPPGVKDENDYICSGLFS